MSEKEISLGQPVTKLIEAVSKAIGKAYEPRYKRKMADANAYELEKVSDEIRKNADLPIKYTSTEGYAIDISDYEALAERTGKRLAYQELARQNNIETIIDGAYESIQDESEMNDTEVSREWMYRFIDGAGDIGTEELQMIWSKVLAGEVLEPSSFSLRTLACLKNLSAEEANLFNKICEIVVDRQIIINDKTFLDNHGITYADILKLDEAGLINSSSILSYSIDIQSRRTLLDFGSYILIGETDEPSNLRFEIYPLKEAGRELSVIVDRTPDLEIIKEISRIISQKNSKLTLSLHVVNSRDQNGIDYDDNSIPF